MAPKVTAAETTAAELTAARGAIARGPAAKRANLAAHDPGSARRRLLATLVVLSLTTAGCSEPPSDIAEPPQESVAATLDGTSILVADFEDYLRRNADPDSLDLNDAALSRLLDQFLDKHLLARLAADSPSGADLPVAPPIESGAVEQAIRQLALDAAPPPTDADIEAAYRTRLATFEQPERVQLRQILTYDRSTAEDALAALEAGESFADVAARLSIGPRKDLGGDQGRLARSDLPRRFADEIFDMAPGTHSGIFRADYGFQIFQVVERLPARVTPLADVRDGLRAELWRRRVDVQLAALLAEARERYDLQLFPSHLPFAYRGSYA
ncbi:MAG: peptidylprolyl isomerase [Acidobacteriota bacterium]